MVAVQMASANETARFKRALRAAESVFKRLGFRAATMEEVARQAQLSKATLYTYFRNKDELYIEVCARLARLLRGAVEQALDRRDVPLDMRLARAVTAKHRMVFMLLRGSTHLNELVSCKDALAGEFFTELDTAILKLLRDAMSEDPDLAANADRLARALYLGSMELAHRSVAAPEMEAEVVSFVRVYMAGVRALAPEEIQG
jgi:AcrR family transcriptional regulator